MSWSIAIVCEAPADRETASSLAARVVCDAVNWMEPEYLVYRGFRPTDPHLLWIDVFTQAGTYRFPKIGLMRGEPGSPDAHAATRALLLLTRLKIDIGPVDAVFLIRDSDNDLSRRDGLNQARDREQWPFPVVIGFAHTKRECWHIAGFQAEDEQEQQRLDELNEELGGDPCTRSEELTAKHDYDKRSAKRVLKVLTNGDPERQQRCLTALPLDELARRGKNNGLADFLTELRQHLLPLFGAVPPN